ncbi:unnamed protein product [Kuraishia capsulata CBS 1993]|uniref:Protein kinase domain-containing protein n=1 Tax=Kuraishia capsulata CBS 1993 TaxID=1382522 RepID=W6MY13_9ASCO|nr:uncharacterized protein KUCA_T00005829001 [Kuraishia capsulata CBS 1993]CDK29835.1 unnamed protein product [Kuraishia capsulata CBS 1993]
MIRRIGLSGPVGVISQVSRQISGPKFPRFGASVPIRLNSTGARQRVRPKLLSPIAIAVGSSVVVSSLFFSDLVFNDAPKLHSGSFKRGDLLTNKHELVPDEEGDTFESGLYISSQKEIDEQERLAREHDTQISRWRLFHRVRYFFLDKLWDPFVTVCRFMELTFIFLPVVLLFPITFFGHKNNSRGDVRAGNILWYKYIRLAAELGGASFIKLGQWAASRTDIFPDELCNELSSLHSNATPHSFKQTKRIICETFNGMAFEDIFEEFQEHPVGCGAIAQVYYGKLKPELLRNYDVTSSSKSDGSEYISNDEPKHMEWVAVKVVHPNVEIKIERDLRIMRFFANLINFIPTMEWLSLPDEVEQFSVLMKMQLDLRIEGHNLVRFHEKFKDRHDIKFPKPYLKFSGREVLVEERIVGLSMGDMLELKSNFGKGLSKELSDKLLDAFLQMLILDNFVHADLHPGNMFIRFYKGDSRHFPGEPHTMPRLSSESEMDQLALSLHELSRTEPSKLQKEMERLYDEGYHVEVCFIDAGLVTELNETDRVNFIGLFNALSEFDGYRAGELMIERSRTPETAIDKEVFALKVERLVDRIKQRTFTLGSVSIGDLLDQVLGMVRQHHVRMEGDFVTVVVAILLLEGIGRQLDPNLDLFASALPVLRQLGLQDGRMILKNGDKISMLKVWLALEVRQFIHASIQDVHKLVKSDGLSPNY